MQPGEDFWAARCFALSTVLAVAGTATSSIFHIGIGPIDSSFGIWHECGSSATTDCGYALNAKCRTTKAFSIIGTISSVAASVCLYRQAAYGIWCGVMSSLSGVIIVAIYADLHSSEQSPSAGCGYKDLVDFGPSFYLWLFAFIASSIGSLMSFSPSCRQSSRDTVREIFLSCVGISDVGPSSVTSGSNPIDQTHELNRIGKAVDPESDKVDDPNQKPTAARWTSTAAKTFLWGLPFLDLILGPLPYIACNPLLFVADGAFVAGILSGADVLESKESSFSASGYYAQNCYSGSYGTGICTVSMVTEFTHEEGGALIITGALLGFLVDFVLKGAYLNWYGLGWARVWLRLAKEEPRNQADGVVDGARRYFLGAEFLMMVVSAVLDDLTTVLLVSGTFVSMIEPTLDNDGADDAAASHNVIKANLIYSTMKLFVCFIGILTALYHTIFGALREDRTMSVPWKLALFLLTVGMGLAFFAGAFICDVVFFYSDIILGNTPSQSSGGIGMASMSNSVFAISMIYWPLIAVTVAVILPRMLRMIRKSEQADSSTTLHGHVELSG